MRRMLFLAMCVGLLGTMLGCHCYHGVCDCDLAPPGTPGPALGPGAGPGPGPGMGVGHGGVIPPGAVPLMPKAGARLTPVPLEQGVTVVQNG